MFPFFVEKELGEKISMVEQLPLTSPMPVLFLGHGSPMNAIEDNEFVTGFRSVGKSLPRPRAILCISAHWETRGSKVTAMERPKTIHDFGGFPKALYDIQYPAPGDPTIAKDISSLIKQSTVSLDYQWGLDHGAWTVIMHLFPQADVPVIQLSLDKTKTPMEHVKIAQELSSLREKGILIIGSGNMVHNLGLVAWDKLNSEPFAYDWAIEANEKMKHFIVNNDLHSLADYKKHGKAFELAIPTPEHYLPLLYAMALSKDNEEITLFNDQPVGGSLTMTSVKIG